MPPVICSYADAPKEQPNSPIVDLDALVERLEDLDLPEGVEIMREPSAVSGSPYDYVYVYLTPAHECDKHLIVSDVREWEDEDGYLVGRHEHYEESSPWDDSETVTTIDAAVMYVVREVGAELGEAVHA